jgi:tRNA threonylcarbamoyladenosine biosynthesis protein TsaE
MERHISRSETETLSIAAEFAATLRPGDVVALTGNLGAGKTVFTRGVANALGVSGEVTSPTFTLIHEYRGELPLYHMDLYRLNTEREILDIGVEDYFYSDGVCLVEWAEKLGVILPPEAIRITILHLDNRSREIIIERPSEEKAEGGTEWTDRE